MENIINIISIQFSSGAYWIETAYTGKFTLEVNFGKLLCKYSYKSDFYKNIIKWKISNKHSKNFINELIELDIFSWKNNYTEDALDGGYWLLKIEYRNNEKIEINGHNAYPENYNNLIEILWKYFPIIKFDNEYRIKIQKKHRT